MNIWQKFLKRVNPYHGTVYHRIGGDKTINKLVEDFYQVMGTDPKASRCLATHGGKDLAHTAPKLKDFLSGWLGGPQRFVEKYGHPRMRMRHLPFAIGEAETKEWLYCMEEALKKSSIDDETRAEMMKALTGLAYIIKNRD